MDKLQDLHTRVRDLRDFAKEVAGETADEKGAVLAATAREVLAGLEEAFDHYNHKEEKPWQ